MSTKLTQDRFRNGTKGTPEELAKRRAYYQRPEVKARYKERAKTAKYVQYHHAYRNSATAKQHHKEYTRIRKYHFEFGLFDKLFSFQNGKCAVCQRQLDTSSPRSIHSDHCHDSKTARGVLCSECNFAEGRIKKTSIDPVEFGQRLAAYLADPPAQQLKRAEHS